MIKSAKIITFNNIKFTPILIIEIEIFEQQHLKISLKNYKEVEEIVKEISFHYKIEKEIQRKLKIQLKKTYKMFFN